MSIEQYAKGEWLRRRVDARAVPDSGDRFDFDRAKPVGCGVLCCDGMTPLLRRDERHMDRQT